MGAGPFLYWAVVDRIIDFLRPYLEPPWGYGVVFAATFLENSIGAGVIVPGETEEQAAVREVLEETGLEVNVESDLGDIRYFYVWEGVRVRKRVHFFLMRMTGGDVEDHDTEMEDVRWFPLRSAVKRAAYKGEREVIERAVERLA